MASVRVVCTPSAWRAPFRGRQRLPVAVLGLLAVAPRVSQRQEQQQRTQALAQLPRRRSSPAQRRRNHRGRSRLLPSARALCPPCARLLRARPPPPPSLSPAGGAGGQGRLRHLRRHRGWAAVALGDQARSWGAERKFRRPAGERPGGWRAGSRSPRPGWPHRHQTRWMDSALGCALLLASVLGCAERRVRKAGGCTHL